MTPPPTPGARRRFDAMLERAVHKGTPIEEARTALEGARSVAGRYEIPRSAERITAAETVLGFRSASDALGTFAASIERAGESARAVFDVVRDPDGTYRRRYR